MQETYAHTDEIEVKEGSDPGAITDNMTYDFAFNKVEK